MPESHQLRPFGPLKWILNRLHDVGKWSVIGSFSAEDRCVAAPLAVEADAGAAARHAKGAPLAVEADADAAARRALEA